MPDEPTGTTDPAKPAEPAAEPKGEPTSGSSDKTFSQDQLDAIVKDRLARERAKYEGFEDLKAKAAELDKLKEAGATELEKAQKRAEKAEAASAAALKTANERLLVSSLLTEATKAGVEAHELLLGVVDRSALTVADDGTVTGTAEAVKAAVAKFPQLVGKAKGSGDGDQGARGTPAGQFTQEQVEAMTPAEVDKNLREGKLNHLLGGK